MLSLVAKDKKKVSFLGHSFSSWGSCKRFWAPLAIVSVLSLVVCIHGSVALAQSPIATPPPPLIPDSVASPAQASETQSEISEADGLFRTIFMPISLTARIVVAVVGGFIETVTGVPIEGSQESAQELKELGAVVLQTDPD